MSAGQRGFLAPILLAHNILERRAAAPSFSAVLATWASSTDLFRGILRSPRLEVPRNPI